MKYHAKINIFLVYTLFSSVLLLMAESPNPASSRFVESTPEVQQIIENGLKWLIEAQNKDGSWGIDKGCPADIGTTAVVCMTLMSEGSTPLRGKYAASLRKANNYILKVITNTKHPNICPAEEYNQIVGKMGRYAHTYFTVLYLTQIKGMINPEDEETIGTFIKKAITFIDEAQEPSGAWGFESYGSSLTTSTAWLSLRGAYSIGFSIKHASMDKTIKFFKDNYNPKTGRFNIQQRTVLIENGAMLRVLYGIGEWDTPEAQSVTKNLLNPDDFKGGPAPYVQGEDYLATVYATQALMHNDKSPDWKKWFSYIRNKLRQLQNKDGSWAGQACLTSRTFATACSVWTLLTPNRILPMVQF